MNRLNMLWSGKIVSPQRRILRYLVDNDLSPDIAAALNHFDIDIMHVQSVFPLRPEGVPDEEIIDWCGNNDAVWITHD